MKPALKLVFPKRARGRPGNGADAIYQEHRRIFCEVVLEIRSTLDFDVSSRGWAYIFENRNTITKAEIDSCQELINHCRKSGELPLNICSVDESRAFENVDYIDDTDAEDEASNIFDRIRDAHHGVRKVEANALVVAPAAGRALCRAAIERHISTIRIPEYEAALQDAQDEVASAVRRPLAESPGGADG